MLAAAWEVAVPESAARGPAERDEPARCELLAKWRSRASADRLHHLLQGDDSIAEPEGHHGADRGLVRRSQHPLLARTRQGEWEQVVLTLVETVSALDGPAAAAVYAARLWRAFCCHYTHAHLRPQEIELVLHPGFRRFIDVFDFISGPECVAAGMRAVRAQESAIEVLLRPARAPSPQNSTRHHA